MLSHGPRLGYRREADLARKKMMNVWDMLTLRCLRSISIYVHVYRFSRLLHKQVSLREEVRARDKIMEVISVQVVIKPWVCMSSCKKKVDKRTVDQ